MIGLESCESMRTFRTQVHVLPLQIDLFLPELSRPDAYLEWSHLCLHPQHPFPTRMAHPIPMNGTDDTLTRHNTMMRGETQQQD
jgi:hypothetical protein